MTPTFRYLAGLLLLSFSSAFAQSTARGNAADDAWASLAALRQSATLAGRASNGVTPATAAPASNNVAPGNSGATPAAGNGEATAPGQNNNAGGNNGAPGNSANAKAQASRQVAQSAKAFYTAYPTHPQAAAAKKLEATAGIEGIGTPTAAGVSPDAAYEATALHVAGNFRKDQANPISDRFEVAHAMERYGVMKKLGGQSWLSRPFEAEALADRLHAEFGHLPETYGLYLHVAEHTNCDHSGDVAARLLRMPAPAPIKARAQALADRAAMIRQPLNSTLTASDGRALQLSGLAGWRTVVVFWSPTQSPQGPGGLQAFTKNADPGIKWVYVAVGTPPPLAKNAKKPAAPPGTDCVEKLGLKSPLLAQLKVEQLPWVLLLDDQKRLSSFGRPDELPWMLANVNRLLDQ